MNTRPKSASFLKECMADALLLLMRQEPFSRITICQIVQAAGVHRSTWFRHFRTKNEALTFKLVQLWNRWADEHGMQEPLRYTLGNAGSFFAFSYSIRETLTLLYRSELSPCIYDAFYQIMIPHFASDASVYYEARFYAYGLFGFLDEWINRNFRESPEQLAALFQKMTGTEAPPEGPSRP